MYVKKAIFLLIAICFLNQFALAQKKDIEQLSREQVLELSTQELLDLPLEDLIKASEIAGVSINKLFQLVHQTQGVRSETKRSQWLSPVPVDVISSEFIRNSGYTELTQILQYILPSFHSTHQTIADGTDSYDPAALRGLSPDQMLVLVNGKRRHTSAYLHVNGTFGKGSVGTDLNTIPVAAIERIEIMRNGAAAQYGSDAISGVINVILKGDTRQTNATTQTGITRMGDGQQLLLSANRGFQFAENGFINITSEFNSRGSVNRSGDYTGQLIYGDSRDNDPEAREKFFEQTPFIDQRVMEIGSAAIDNMKLFLNASVPVGDYLEVYATSGFSLRQGASGGFYRFPYETNKVVSELYPYGFSPNLSTNILDNSFTIGLLSEFNDWRVDFYNSTGINSFDIAVNNANNASMGISSPTSAYSGGFGYWQNITGLDFSRKLNHIAIPVNIAFGAEYRFENYRLRPGEEASWINGDKNNPEATTEIGFQLYPGFRPENELNRYRTNSAAYIDLEFDFTPNWMLGLASRYESYSDFGSNLSWKAASRYRFADILALRASASTGFRAPSLPQTYYNRISIQILNGESVQVVNFNNESSAAKLFGIQKLKPELANNYSIGLTSKPSDNIYFAFDAYQINIKDRIIMTGRFDAVGNHGQPTEYAYILQPMNVGSAQFITNAIDTKTKGIDTEFSFNTPLWRGSFLTSLTYNYSETKLDGPVKTTPVLEGKEDILFNREEISRIECVQPSSKFILTNIYKTGVITIILRNTRFGRVKYIYPSEEPEMNALTGQIESRDQRFSPKIITDIDIGFDLMETVKWSFGANNVFDIYPDKHKHSKNIHNGLFLYSRRVQQFGVNGLFVYTKILFQL